MDDLDDFEGEEEVDYDFNLDDDVEEGGDPVDSSTPKAVAASGSQTTAAETTQQQPFTEEVPTPRAGSGTAQLTPANKAKDQPQPAEPAKGGGGRQKIPVPARREAVVVEVGNLLPGRQTGLEGVDPEGVKATLAAAAAVQRQNEAIHRGQNPVRNPGRGAPPQSMTWGRGPAVLPGRGMGGRGMPGARPAFYPQLPGQGPRPPSRPALNRPLPPVWPQQNHGMREMPASSSQLLTMRMGQGRPNGLGQGARPQGQGMGSMLRPMAFLPMPPGLPMPGMMEALEGGGMGGDRHSNGSMSRGGSQDHHGEGNGHSWHASRGERVGMPQPPSMPQPPTMDHGDIASGRGGSARRGVWDRLKAPPQLAGDFDAGEEFEAPPKRRAPQKDSILPPTPPTQFPGRTQQGGLFLPPTMNGNGNPGLPMPEVVVPAMDNAREKAAQQEKAKQAAEDARRAEITRRVAAQREENALLVRLRELEKQVKENQIKEELAAIKVKMAEIEAKAKQHPTNEKATGVAPVPQPASKVALASPRVAASPPAVKASPVKRKAAANVETPPSSKKSRSPDSDSERPAPRGRGIKRKVSPVPGRVSGGLKSSMERGRERERGRSRSPLRGSPTEQLRDETDLRYLLQSKRARKQDEPEKLRSGKSIRRHS